MSVDTRAAAKVAPSQKLSTLNTAPTDPTAEDFALLWANASGETRAEIVQMLHAASGHRDLPRPLWRRLSKLAGQLRASRLTEDRDAAGLISRVWG